MKVTINRDELRLVLDAIADSEHRWRESAWKQPVEVSHQECLDTANALHTIYRNLESELGREDKRVTETQKVDPFDNGPITMRCWDPNDPRNW